MNKIIKASNFFIKNMNVPSCKNCIHFMEYKSVYDLSKCKLYGEKNIISDKIEYDFAIHCRNNENKCGINAKHFFHR
jgi:hypothetical protein